MVNQDLSKTFISALCSKKWKFKSLFLLKWADAPKRWSYQAIESLWKVGISMKKECSSLKFPQSLLLSLILWIVGSIFWNSVAKRIHNEMSFLVFCVDFSEDVFYLHHWKQKSLQSHNGTVFSRLHSSLTSHWNIITIYAKNKPKFTLRSQMFTLPWWIPTYIHNGSSHLFLQASR